MPPVQPETLRKLRARRWLSLGLNLVLAGLLAWPIVSQFDSGPFAPDRPTLDGASPLPPGNTAIAPIGPSDAPTHVTAVMPAGWFVDDNTAEYSDDAKITITAFPLATGFTATDDASRANIATLDTRTTRWRLGPTTPHTYGGHPAVELAFSDDPVEWAGVNAYLFLDTTVVRISCAYNNDDTLATAMDGCLTALGNVRVAA